MHTRKPEEVDGSLQTLDLSNHIVHNNPAQTQADEMAELSEQLEDLEPSPSLATSRTAGEDLG